MQQALIPTDAAGRTLRHDGWTPDRQRAFLESIAAGETVERACRLVQMSVASAYALKQRATGQSFALGWRAANLLGREAIADRMLTRAMDGYVETVTRPDGSTYSRHKYDNRTAMTLLTRLDRQAEQAPADPDAAAHNQAARMVAQDWDAYLALLEADRGPAAAGLFLARRLPDATARPGMEPVLALARADAFLRTGAGLPQEVATADLDPAQRAIWTGEQWARAEASGLVRVAPEPEESAPAPQHLQLIDEDEEERPVWWDDAYAEWRTRMAPPADEIPMFESGTFGEEDYERSLTTSERAIADRRYAHIAAGHAAAAEADRRAYFAGLEAEIAAAEAAANDGSELGEGPDSSRPAGLEPAWRAPLADPQFRHAGLEPASSMPLGDHDDESAPTAPPADAWTPVQGRVDEGMENATPIRHAGLEPASRAPLGDDGDESAPTEPPAGTWTPAQGRGDEILVDAPNDSPAPGPTPWPSFAQMLAGDPAELARYGVRVD